MNSSTCVSSSMAARMDPGSDDNELSPLHSYEDLQSPKHIRIIILEPSIDPGSPLVFSFYQGSLAELEGDYEALSYTWGIPELVFPLHCLDGSRVYVTENLDRALRRLRLKADKRRLWADAACINQKNASEKAVQIPLMVDIFRGAKGVLAWLGPGGSGEEDAVRLLAQLSRRNVSKSKLGAADGDTFESAGISAATDILLALPWFKRMWIIQEVVFNQDVTLICGRAEMSWVRFFASLNASKKFLAHHPSVKDIGTIFSLWQKHSMVHELHQDAQDAGIIELMTKFGQYQCSDERDRIYALCSLASDVGKNVTRTIRTIPLEIDYRLDLLETYRSFAEAAICNGNLLAVLRAASDREMITVPSSWPSWVPDWRRPLPTHAGFTARKDYRLIFNPIQFHFLGNRVSAHLSSAHLSNLDFDFREYLPPNQLIPILKGPEYLPLNDKDQSGSYFTKIYLFFCRFGCPFHTPSEGTLPSVFSSLWECISEVVPENLSKMLSRHWRNATLGEGDRYELSRTEKALKGLCVFNASLTPDSTLIGIGSNHVQDGDRLVVMASHLTDISNVYMALILRPIGGFTKGFRMVGLGHVAVYNRYRNCPLESRFICGFVDSFEGHWSGRIEDYNFTIV